MLPRPLATAIGDVFSDIGSLFAHHAKTVVHAKARELGTPGGALRALMPGLHTLGAEEILDIIQTAQKPAPPSRSAAW